MDKEPSTLLHEIKAETGWSETKLGAEIGVRQPTVNRILKGQPDCKGTTLRSIEALHARVFTSEARRRSTDAPL